MNQALTPVLTAAPLVLVSSAKPLACSASELACAVNVLRRTCIFTLIGVLAAVGFVASIIRCVIPQETGTSHDAAVTESAA